MSAAFDIRGWCPSALRPMASGDGLLVRLRPQGGWLSRAQAAGIARLSGLHGSGEMDLTSRGALQIRGVAAAVHPALVAALQELQLVARSSAEEAAEAVLSSPFSGPDADVLARAAAAALATGPVLPSKFGIAVDAGPARVLADVPADLRVERAAGGGLILRADGAAEGWAVVPETLTSAIRTLIAAFAERGGIGADGRGRMAAFVARGGLMPDPLPGRDRLPPAPAEAPPSPGPHACGTLVGLAFGGLTAAHLAALAGSGPLRLTPWRMLLLPQGTAMPDLPGLVRDAADPRLRVLACVGAPRCPQAEGGTRELAETLAPRLAPHLGPGEIVHVAGCAKGCAHRGPARLTLLAAPGGYRAIPNGSARDVAPGPVFPAAALAALPAARLLDDHA